MAAMEAKAIEADAAEAAGAVAPSETPLNLPSLPPPATHAEPAITTTTTASPDETKTKLPSTSKPRRVVRRKKKAGGKNAPKVNPEDIPPHIMNNAQLHHVISTSLPKDYEFEILKTLWRIERSGAEHVALQMPEGLLMYASVIADILSKFIRPSRKDASPLSVSVLGDVTYGACCVDDLNARALGCDLLVHYGHSCLVPLTASVVPCLYIFVEIGVDVDHLVECFRTTFADDTGVIETDGAETRTGKMVETLVMGTIQFRSAIVEAARRINDEQQDGSGCVRFRALVPQAKPLSPGEVLGCTAPSGLAEMDFDASSSRRKNRRKVNDKLITPPENDRSEAGTVVADVDKNTNSAQDDTVTTTVTAERVMLFLADGRFHLEAAMIANPTLRALRYCPYSKTLTDERYEVRKMKDLRRRAVESVKRLVAGAETEDEGDAPPTVGIVLGTLGRQGNPAVLRRLRDLLRSRNVRSIVVLLSEIFPAKLELLSDSVDAWVQVACPRLSVDWGHFFRSPVLSPYELHVALGKAEPFYVESRKNDDSDDGPAYPMDFYSNNGGAWTNYHPDNRARKMIVQA